MDINDTFAKIVNSYSKKEYKEVNEYAINIIDYFKDSDDSTLSLQNKFIYSCGFYYLGNNLFGGFNGVQDTAQALENFDRAADIIDEVESEELSDYKGRLHYKMAVLYNSQGLIIETMRQFEIAGSFGHMLSKFYLANIYYHGSSSAGIGLDHEKALNLLLEVVNARTNKYLDVKASSCHLLGYIFESYNDYKSSLKYLKQAKADPNLPVNEVEDVEKSIDRIAGILGMDDNADTINDIADYFSPETLNYIDDNTKIFIHTAIDLFNYLMNNEDKALDYSCVIISLVKAIENELFRIIFTEYVKYLSDKYYQADEVSKYLTFDNRQQIKSYMNDFSIGKAINIMSFFDYEKGFKIYPSFVKFAQECGVSDAENYIRELCNQLDFLRIYRNKSTHHDRIDFDVANDGFTYVFETTKVLDKFVLEFYSKRSN